MFTQFLHILNVFTFLYFTHNSYAQYNIFPSIKNQLNFLNLWAHTQPTTDPILYDYYDYIVVGAGAAGCPLAFTLAEAGYKTLLIERGMNRKQLEAETTLYISGLSKGVNDPLLSQLIITPQGVRTHIPNIIGGGTSLNLGIYTEENSDYFNYLETFPGVEFDYEMLNNSTDWVYERIANKMPQNDSFGAAWRATMSNLGYQPHQNDSSTHTSFTQYSRHILMDKYWGGMSTFNASENFFRNAADVLLFDKFGELPQNLTVLTEHNVEKVTFNMNGTTPKAECVEFKYRSKFHTFQSVSPRLKGLFDFDWAAISNVINDPFGALKKLFNIPNPSPLLKACVNTGGEIIISSGAIMSSVILFKSGVGPSDMIKSLDIPLVKDIPKLGKNFKDRIFIPVGFFFNEPLPKNDHFEGRVCRGIGLRQSGYNCTHFKMGDENLGCSLIPIEEFSGAEIGENIFYATRYPFPPEWRDHPILELFFEFFEKCSINGSPFGSPLLKPFCKIVEPITICLKKSGANFYLLAEPKSTGEVILKADGTIIADPKYLTHNQDLIDSIRGIADLTQQINMDPFKSLLEEYSKHHSCPATIYNGILEIVTEISTHIYTKQLNIKQLIPMKNLLEQLKLTSNLPQFDTKIFKRNLQNSNSSEFLSNLNENNQTNFDVYPELGYLLYEINKHFQTAIKIDKNGEFSEIDSDELQYRLSTIKKLDNQWAATFPPILPDPSNPHDLASYAMNYMSSVWHHYGTAPLGEVVDNNFNVKGIEGLSIVDASNLNQITRLNPSATIMMLGRYAGSKKVQNKQII